MQKIIPNLWFDHRAEEAVRFYTGLFPGSKITRTAHYDKVASEVSGMKEGEVLSMDFELAGQAFIAINADDHYRFTPSVSLTVYCESEREIDDLWKSLSAGGKILMELGEYPFSRRFGFLQDRFGVAWQLNLKDESRKIVPTLIFVGDVYGRAEEAMNFYLSLFKEGRSVAVAHQPHAQDSSRQALLHGIFRLFGQEFVAMDGSGHHAFGFTGAVSFMVLCENQQEIDLYWKALGMGGKEMPCGWIEDGFGVTWQIVPAELHSMLTDPDPARSRRAMQAMFQMKKFDIATLRAAYAGG